MKRKRKEGVFKLETQIRSGNGHPFGTLRGYNPAVGGEDRIYRALREALPILDGAIQKLIRLTGSFQVRCPDPAAEKRLRDFLRTVPCGRGQYGIDSFLSAYLDSLLTYGRSVEQLVARTGLPPFLLGLSWSATERMSTQQSDILTTELWALRRAVTPALERICRTWLRLEGFGCGVELEWDDISLQDLVEEARADLYHAQAEKIRKELQ